MTLVSVITPNWNRRELLRCCLRSLEIQTLSDHEVIVVDNGSTDGSVEMVRAEFPRATVISNRENRGFCAAINQGIEKSRGRYVALLNNDAEADPRWLATLVAALVKGASQRPEIGMCASKIMRYDNHAVIDKVGHLIYPDGQNRGRACGQIDHGQFDRVEEALFPDGCAALYDRRVFETAGVFDEDFFAYGDDAEMGLRARLAGWGCLYVPGAIVYHRHASTLGRFSSERLVLVERNRLWLAAKLFPWRLLLLNPFYCLLRWTANVVAGARGKGEAGGAPLATLAYCALRATAKGLAGLPRMLAKRRHVVRRVSEDEFLSLLGRFRISLRELAFQSQAIPAASNSDTALAPRHTGGTL